MTRFVQFKVMCPENPAMSGAIISINPDQVTCLAEGAGGVGIVIGTTDGHSRQVYGTREEVERKLSEQP